MFWTINDNKSCEYCGQTFTSSNIGTTDHLIPKGKFRAYADVPWTWVISCLSCNLRKADYVNPSIPFIPENRDLLIEDVRINKLKITSKH